jgi:peptide/nickel transport system permease protein
MTVPWRWLVRRLGQALLVILGAATIAFAALHLVPGDPVRTLLGPANTSDELAAQVRADLGLDQPILLQYLRFLGRLLTGDLGTSYQLQQPVRQVIGSQLGPTLALALAGLVLGVGLAAVLAVATAGRRRALRLLSSTVELVAASTPAFATGVLLLTFFSFRWHLFPVAGGSGLEGLALPAVTLALGVFGPFAQVLREGMERALAEPFVLSSRARGTGELLVRVRHALRHALVPVITLSGWAFGALLSGAVIIETVFGREGLGRTLAGAIASRDLPVVTGIVVVSAAAFAVINIGVDWLYRVVDPRLRESAR